jgi:hypothetical protein
VLLAHRAGGPGRDLEALGMVGMGRQDPGCVVEGCGGVVAGEERGEMDPHGGVVRRGGQDGFEGGPDGGIKSHPAIVATMFGKGGENRAHRRETLLASEGDGAGHTDGQWST